MRVCERGGLHTFILLLGTKIKPPQVRAPFLYPQRPLIRLESRVCLAATAGRLTVGGQARASTTVFQQVLTRWMPHTLEHGVLMNVSNSARVHTVCGPVHLLLLSEDLTQNPLVEENMQIPDSHKTQ